MAAVAACTKPNPAACCVDQSTCKAADLPGPKDCGGGLVCVNNACVAPTGSAQCGANADCPATMPICTSANVCIQCQTGTDCSGTTPVCDVPTNSCVACTSDDDCSSSVCNEDTGACVSADAIAYASPTGPATADCQQTTPCSIATAVATATAGTGRDTVRLLPGDYMTNIEVFGGTPIKIVGTGAHVIESQTTPDPSIYVRNGANVTIRDLKAEELYIDGATTVLSMRRVTFLSTTQYNVMGDGHASLDDVSFADVLSVGDGTYLMDRVNVATAMTIAPGVRVSATITNSILGAIDLASANTYDVAVSLSTIYGKDGLNDDNFTVQGSFAVTDSIIVSTHNANAAICSSCAITNCILQPQPTAIPGNRVADPKFVNALAGDFHLQAVSPAIDGATNTTVDHDYDGLHRPQGSASDIGAFERAP